MRSCGIVPGEIGPETSLQFLTAVRQLQIDVLILDRAPEPLHKDVVQSSALAIHTDADAVLFEYREEAFRSELRVLITVEDLGRAVPAQGFAQGLGTESRIQTVQNPPGEDLAAEPVHRDDEVLKSPRHGR